MEISFIIVCLIVVGMVCIPYVLLITIGKTENKKTTSTIKKMILENHLNIDQFDQWNHKYMGLDSQQRKMIFVKEDPKESSAYSNQIEIIDLTTVKSCNVIERRKSMLLGKRKEQILEKLEMQLTFKNDMERQLCFYDIDDSDQENLEVARIEKWKVAITTLLTDSNVLKQAS